jgi:predicted dehydrogenase
MNQDLTTSPAVRMGVLGTARVVSYGLVEPAKDLPGLRVEAIASRSLERAQAFAAAQGIGRSFGSYQALLDDDEIDAVYIALPTALHPEWVRRALEAGKHVLCEKPLTANWEIARELATIARVQQRVLLEGMHLRYSGTLRRQRELVESGDFGRILRIESCFRVRKIPNFKDDFRNNFDLGGGAAMDIGCYAVSCLRYLAGGEPRIGRVHCRRSAAQVDRWMRATCQLPGGIEGIIECGLRGWYRSRVGVNVKCERGSIKWHGDGLACETNGRKFYDPTSHGPTQQKQLQAFVDSIQGRPSFALSPEDAIANARVLDAMYAGAGLAPRPTSA